MHGAGIRHLIARRRGEITQRIDEVAHTEIAQRRTEEYRRHVTFQERLTVEGAAGFQSQFRFLDKDLALIFRQTIGDSLRAVDRKAIHLRVVATKGVFSKIVSATEALRPADRPGDRRGIERKLFLDLIQNLEGIAAFAVHLVDEGDDRNIAHAANFEKLQRARLDTLGGIDDHDRRIHRRQRAVGVIGKVFVAGRIEDVEDAVVIFEGHDRSDDRNAALALDLHPVRTGLDAILLRLHLTGKLDRSAEQQQFFRKRGLTRVRVRNNSKGAAAGDRLGKCFGHLTNPVELRGI